MLLRRGIKVWKSEFGTKGFLYPTDSSFFLEKEVEVESLPFVSSDRELVAFKFKDWSDEKESPVHWVDVKTWNYAKYEETSSGSSTWDPEDSNVSKR
jgi:hypothetical protein